MPENAHQYTDSDPVVAQYERWAYPAPVNDLADPSIARYLATFLTLRNMSLVYWPAGQPREDLDILVAGCGTMAAACYAHHYPRCRITGIDISRTSLAHHERLKQRHNLLNLTLHHCPIEQVGSLDGQFDYISCHGVLHHLPDPAAGLAALKGVLRQDGVIALMLYARYGRAAVYAFQDLFRMIGLEQSPEDVAIVRQTLSALPADHPLGLYLRRATDLDNDAGLVDTFLHRRDQAYRVSDCLALLNDAGLVFQGWDRNFFYHADGLFAGAPMLRDRINRLPRDQAWQAVELAFGMIGTHWFFACRPDRDPLAYQMPWESAALFNCIPIAGAKLLPKPDPGGAPQWAVARPNFPAVALTARQAAIFSQIDGRRTVGQCLVAAGVEGGEPSRLAAAQDCFQLLWRIGFGILRLPKSA
ncbi:MAG TPA: class I SAM-dependent methyltransferase [Tepidisphaeraceae bacterium]|nr:class I SAM-dependent methyltransferase [Tepidisphaeraceae bacterium]